MSLRSFTRDTGVVFSRSLAQARRSPILALGFPVAFPLLMIGLFSQIYGKVTQVPGFPAGSYITFMTPAVFLMSAMFGSGYSATGLVQDVETGFMDRLRLVPASSGSILLGRLLFDVARVIVAGSAVLALSVVFGAHYRGGVLGVLGMLTLLVIWTLGYTGLFYFVGLRSRSTQKLAVLIPLFLPISLISTAYVPANLAPSWMRTAAKANPYTHLVNASRHFMNGTGSWSSLGIGVLAGLLLVALTQLGAARAFAGLVTEN
jgi:ABC-2 type transport system permease protein